MAGRREEEGEGSRARGRGRERRKGRAGIKYSRSNASSHFNMDVSSYSKQLESLLS